MYTVLLQASDPAIADRWAKMLAEAPVQIKFAGQTPTCSSPPEVVVTDVLPTPEASASPAAGTPTTGWVIVGPTPRQSLAPTDVFLPADCTARELQLACRLIAELVRLRRHQQAANATEAQLAQEALTDPLTGLPNRRAWELAVKLERMDFFRWPPWPADATGSDQRMLLCASLLDLDHFKHINDEHGYLAGDDVLRTAARALQTSLRQGDFVARVGGDEFALLLPVHDPASALAIIERLRKSVPQRLLAEGRHAVTVSAGYCVVDSSAAGSLWGRPDQLLEALHAALRRAKQQGRDRAEPAGQLNHPSA